MLSQQHFLFSHTPCQEVYHELVVLERLHARAEFSPGASLEAVTKAPLRRH